MATITHPASKWLLAIIITIYPLHIATGQTIYVDANATGANNGSSWTNAYKYLQDALVAAEPNHEIWVAQGTYKPDKDTNHPTGTNDRNATFQLKNGVAIYGGYPSGGGSRNPNVYKTILSGDINVPDVNTDNSYHVVTGSGTNSSAVFDGFIITAGHASGAYPFNCGGGMYSNAGNPTVANCTFIGNSASYGGGGMFNSSSSPTVTNCAFSGNSADYGGGMLNENSNPTLTDCIFNGNSASYGGGMYNEYSNPTLTNCTFNGNSASYGGGMENNDNSSPTLINCTFIGNSATYGGGIYDANSSPTLTNCVFSGNSATYGGGMCNYGSSTLTNCTFSGNLAATYGGGMYSGYGSSTLTNCIFWGNTASTGPQIYTYDSPIVRYCDVQGGWSGTGNIDANPLFVDANGPDNISGTMDDNLRLLFGSPCIDAGDNNAVPGGITTDLDGRPRFINDPRTSDTGNGTPPIVDMGAYEYLPPTLLAWWKFDDGSGTVLTDSSGDGYNGTILGNPTWKTGSQYGGSGYLDFDGADDYVDVNYLPDAFLFPAQYTVSAWFRADGGSSRRDIFSAFDVNQGHGILIELDSPPGRLRYVHRSPLGINPQSNDSVYTTTGYSDGLWHHVAVVRESDTSRLVYVDGQVAASNTNATSALDKPVRVFLGQLRPGDMTRWWNGGIDDVRIYNRALSPEEIAHLIPPPIQNIDTGAMYDTIQEAIDAANNGETIVVQPGTYTGAGNAGIDFMGKAITLRSAEPNDPNAVAATIIDCNHHQETGVYFQNGENANSVLNGFTITNTPGEDGGGIYCYQSSPTIKNCILRNNTADQGGGIYCSNGASPTIHGGTIRNNSPDGIYINAGGSVLILGTVHIISNDIVGDGNLQMGTGGSLDLDNAKVLCNMSGPGTMTVALGAKATINGNAIIDLSDPNDPNKKGTIDCKGTLTVKDNAQINNAKINITMATFEDKAYISKCEIHVDSKAPYGQVFADPNTSFVDVNIYADGDRYMDLDPSIAGGDHYMDLEPNIFDGNFVNVKIFVTITEGVGQLQGGLFECRGEDGFAEVDPCDPNYDPNNIFFCPAKAGTIPDCNLRTWTLERLELIPGAKLTLTNRFPFQPPYAPGDDNDVVYVKELILREGSVLNTSYNKIYYGSLIKEPNAVIKNEPLLGFSLINIAMDDPTEFIVRVTDNNYTDPNEPNYSRAHVERVEGLSPDPNGMMRMSNLLDLDPNSSHYNDTINARAKGLFSKSSEDEILILFEYLFGAIDANTELVVYLSDIPELGDVNDPNDYVKVARLLPPLPGQPGSVGSGRFGVFKQYVPTNGLNFIRGTRIEFMLLGGNGVYMYINNWDPGGCGICLDLNHSDTVETEDFLTLLCDYGKASNCPSMFGEDGTVDSGEICGWDWGSLQSLNCCGMPLTGDCDGTGGSSPAAWSNFGRGYQPNGSGGDFNDILVCGKKKMKSSTFDVLKDALYVFDSNGQYLNKKELTPDSNRANVRLVEDFDGNVYRINSGSGILSLDGSKVIVGSRQFIDINEPRYGTLATVYVGIQGGDDPYGRPILDAAFADNNCVYIVPVVVEPSGEGEEPYVAAAKLHLSGSPYTYSVVKLYNDPDANKPNDSRDVDELCEVEVDNAGNLYVLNACYNYIDGETNVPSPSDILWKYNASSGEMIELLALDDSNSYVPSPTAMYLSTAQDMLYLASSLNEPNAKSSTIYGFSTNGTLPLKRKITVSGMGHVTGITENPTTGTLWVAGFSMKPYEGDSPGSFLRYPSLFSPFYEPNLAKVPIGRDDVNTISSADPNNGLALPLSIVWTGAVSLQKKCGGADLDSSGAVDLKDFSVFAQHWYETGCVVPGWCGGADLDPYIINRGQVDLIDLAIFIQNWLESDCH